MDRREFLKTLGLSTFAMATAGCGVKKEEEKYPVGAGPVPTDAMTYRSFPSLGTDKVSLLGYGCMRWPMKESEGEENAVDQDAVNTLVDYAIAHGVNYFDTSPVYTKGLSERATGIALKRHPREKYYIATKLSNFSDYSRENSLAMYYASFRELQTDYIDYYLLHSIGKGGMERFNARYVDNGMMTFLLAERRAGRIRHLGWSFHGDKETFDAMLALHEEYHWDFVQIQLNYVDWHIPKGSGIDAEYIYRELEKRGIPSVIMEPLLGGSLAKLPDFVMRKMKERAPEHSVASWAFRFAGTPSHVLTVLSGMTYMEHLQDNIRTYSPLKPLNDDEDAFLLDMAKKIDEYPTIPCTGCEYCMPCPYGIDIPGIFRHYNRCVNEGNVPTDRQDPEYRKMRRAYLVSYSRNVEKLRQADHCIGCRKCVDLCPQEIRIPHELHHINDIVERLKQDTV